MNTARKLHLLTSALCFALLPTALPAQDPTVDEAMRASVVQRVGEMLDRDYVFADKGTECAKLLSTQLEAGEYDSLDRASAFAGALTRDLQSVTDDKHLRVRARPVPASRAPSLSPEERRRRQLRKAAVGNFGFHEVKVLPGNVGYLDLRGFIPAEYGGPTAAAAMAFLENADAMIIDLRKNGGGSPSMIQLLSTYFFEERTHLNSFFWRGKEQIDQFWTLPHVDGKRRPEVPLYILTSRRTFSAAEEFTYNLKNLERATIVGETTGGGAHPGRNGRSNEHFEMFIPCGRAINPITKTNWEGTGIEPHIAVAADDALTTAHEEALKAVSERTEDETEAAGLRWVAAGLAAKSKPVVVPAARMNKLAGDYGPRKVTFTDGVLWYSRDNAPRRKLVPMGDGLFQLDGVDDFRVRFEEENGAVVRLVGLYRDGRVAPSPRVER